MTRVVGVDACRDRRWVVVPLTDSGFAEPYTVTDFRFVVHDDAAVVGVDIPIGLPPPFPRRADVDAKAFPNVNPATVFPTFPRDVYAADNHAEAVDAARALTGKGVSRQSWCLGPRILQVERRLVGRVYEAHPEVSFAALARRPLPAKKTVDGREQRRRMLDEIGGTLPRKIPYAAEHDVLDAAIAAWTAQRIARGEAQTLPPHPDPGEPRIWY
jgi:predicted RNase H-like nuclease